ncbi:MAG: MarR family transcriptional regulator [Gemmatimonas sp.]
MPSQPILRPFDIGVALRLLLVPEDRYEPLAAALVTSTSAVHRSVARLGLAGICRPSSRTVARDAFHEFLLHGVRFAFPPMVGPERTGMPTSVAHPTVHQLLRHSTESSPLVWASDLGDEQASSIAPLFAGVPAVASRDPRLHELLAVVDVLRTGSARERKLVGDWLRDGVLATSSA